jgi:hypothetical protein
VSTRAKAAIGLGEQSHVELKEGDAADLVVFGSGTGFRGRKSAQEVVYDAGPERVTYKDGRRVY